MTLVTGFTKDGTQKWQINSATISNGAIDYLGNGFYIIVSGHQIFLATIDSTQAMNTKTLYTENDPEAQDQHKGVAINHSYLTPTQGYQHGRDGIQCYVAKEVLTSDGGDPPAISLGYDVTLFDFQQSGINTMVKSMVSFGADPVDGIGWNGHHLFAVVSDLLGGSTTLRQFDVGSGGAIEVKRSANMTGFTDMFFDGQDFWVVDATNVRQIDTDFTDKFSFAHGLGGVGGICTDGQQIIILST